MSDKVVADRIRCAADAGGRVSAVRTMAWDNDEISKTTYTYTGVDTTTVTVTDDTGFTKSPVTTLVNTDGKIQSRKLYYGTTATGPADVSSYIYDALGQLTRMGDGYNLWTWAYDAAGRQIGSEDPDTGTGTIAYDAAGRVASRTDELNTVTKYTYDVLDRVTKQTVTAAGGVEKTLITNTYDGSGTLGVLSSSTRNNGAAFDQPVTTTFTGFDLAYTPGTTTTTLPAGLTNFNGTYQFTNTTTYTGKTDVAGTPAIAGLPAESVGYGYDEFDNQGEVIGAGNMYAGSGMYNHLNQLTKYSQKDNNFSSGANTAGSISVDLTWDATTGRLDKTQATNYLGINPQDLGTTSYDYDPAGRITSRQQAYTSRPSSPTDNQCYAYDHADRIKAVWTPATTTCGTAPSSTATTVTGLGGPAPYAQTYTYTAAGDRSQVKRFGSNGNLAVTETYAYPAPGTVGPHRVQSVTAVAGSTSTPQAFTWDAAGRMANRAGQTITYTLDGKVDTTTGTSTVPANPNPNATAGTPPAPTTGAGSTGTRFYDAAGNLVGLVDGTGTTITLGSITAHHNAATGAKTATKTYTFAGKVVAQRTATSAGTKVAFIIGDNINTAQTLALPNTTAGTGAVTLVRRTDPLGLARGANSTGTAAAAFTAATSTTAGTGTNAASASGFSAVNGYIAGLDDTISSLTHLGARDMDPVLGVFTAPDPILTTEDHRGFTPYTYAFGSVINASDPSGLYIRAETPDGYNSAPCGCYQREREERTNPGRNVSAATPITVPAPARAPGSIWDDPDIDMGAIGGFPSTQQAEKTGFRLTAEGVGTVLGIAAGAGLCLLTGGIGCLVGGAVLGAAFSTAGWAIDRKGDFTGEELATYAGTDLAMGIIPFCRGWCKGSLGAAKTPLGIHLNLHYMDGWSAAQKAAADMKVENLNNAFISANKTQRGGTSAMTMWTKGGNPKPATGTDIDHIIDLQLGGADTLANLSPLDKSVNRSLGSQIGAQLRGVEPGTPICGVSICAR